MGLNQLYEYLLNLMILFFRRVAAFLVAFCYLFFQNSTSECRAWVGSLSFVVLVLIVWCVIALRGTDHQNECERVLVSADAPFFKDEFDSNSEEIQSTLASTKKRILNKIRNLPYLIRRGSTTLDTTSV